MASNNRDVKMTLSVESLGQENITKLEKSLRDLAKEGGASAEEFGHLADEIARLGGQNQALQAVKALADGTEALSKSQGDAQARVSLMAERLDVLTAATVKAKVAEEQAAQALVDGRKAKIDADTALKQLRASYDAAEKKTAEYQTEVSRLVTEQGNAAKAVQDLTRANQQAEAATSEAVQAQSKAQQELNKATKAYSAATQAAAAHNQALQEAGKAAEALGVDITDLGQAEAELQTSFSRATTAVQQRKTAMADMAEADRLAAVEAQGMLDLYRKGEQALQAEVLAQRDAVRATEAYEAAKAQALADEAAWQREAHGIVEAAEAAQRLKTESERLAAAQQELANQRAFEKQAEDAKAMLRAAEYVRFWEQELEGAERQALETAAAAATAANRIDNAFRTVGVRSVAEVRKEIADVNGSLALLAGSGQLTGRVLSTAMASARERTNELEREIRGLTGTLSLADRAAGLLRDSMGQIAAGNLVADAIDSLIERVKDMGRAFITTIAEAERLQRGLQAVYKDSVTTAKQMGFLRAAAMASGVAMGDLSGSFLKFSAATKAANIPISESNALFLATAKAAGTLGLSGEQVNGMLEALSQMASKGVISLEELRQQMGDRLPGALSLAAQGLGITEKELIALVESGQLAARDFFPAFTKGLQTMQGEVGGLNTTWANFKNVLVGVAQDAGDAGWLIILTGALKALGAVVGAGALTLSGLWEGLRLVGVGAVAMAMAISDGPTAALGFFNEEAQKTIDRLDQQELRFKAMLDPTGEAAKKLREAATANGDLGRSAASAANALSRQQSSSVTTTQALGFQEKAQAILANTTYEYGARIVQVNLLAAEMLKTTQAQSEAAAKSAKAIELQGQSMVLLAKLKGDATATAEAELRATEANIVAAQKQAELARADAEIRAKSIELTKAINMEKGLSAEALDKENKALDDKLTKSKAEADQADATVAKLKQELLQRALNVQTLKDNAAGLEELRSAVVLTQAAVDGYAAQLAKGQGTQEEYARLQERAALAMGLFKDAVKDSADALQQEAAVKSASIQLSIQSLRNRQAEIEAAAAHARALGDNVRAVQLEIQAKEIQIKILKLTAEAKRLEAQATIDATEIEKNSITATDDASRARKNQLEIILLQSKAKLEESKAAKIQVEILEREISALRNGTAARGSSTSAIGAETAAIAANTSEREQAIAAKERELELDKRQEAARTRSASSELGTATGIMNFLKGAGLNDETAAAVAKEFLDSQGNVQFMNNPGQAKYGGQGSTLSQALLKAAEQYTVGGKQQLGGSSTSTTDSGGTTSTAATKPSSGGSAAGGSSSSGSAAPTRGNTKTVVINYRGTNTQIGVASDQDANSLVGFLRQLESDGGRAS